jgi:hypothetical protein
VEVYDKSTNRFFTVTGHRFGDVTTIEDRQEQFNDVYKTVFASLGKTKRQEATPSSIVGGQSAGMVNSALKRLCSPSVPSLWTSSASPSTLTAALMAICPRSSRIIANSRI